MKRLRLLIPLLLLAYFLYFAAGAMHATFAMDDPTNLGLYWKWGLGRTLLNCLRFWSTAYRPMGGVFYLTIYDVFQLNPLPYRIVILGIIGANIALTWAIAEALTGSIAAAGLAAMLACAHASMLTIYYNTSMIYDVLAYFFTALMLAVYVRARAREGRLGAVQVAAVLLAYIAGLDSKEIAVVGAGWVLAYEVLIPKTRRWALAAALIVMGLVFSAGKMIGPDSLSKDPGYKLDFSLHRYFINNELYTNSLFNVEYFHNSRQWLIAWTILTMVCAALRKREVWWCWFLISTAALATSFTVIPRDGGALYLPLLGWALLAAGLIAALMKRPALEWSAVVLIAGLWGWHTISLWREVSQAFLDTQKVTWSAIEQIRALPKPRSNSRVMILNSPFDGWDAYFIAELLWNDPTIEIRMGDKGPAPPGTEELKAFNYILAFDRTTLRVVSQP